MKRSTVKCAHCKRGCIRDSLDSMYPEEGTPPEDIFIYQGDIRFSLLCTNPECHKYTISCIHSGEVDRLSKKYGLKNPSDTD